jgi:hypothetical protein
MNKDDYASMQESMRLVCMMKEYLETTNKDKELSKEELL